MLLKDNQPMRLCLLLTLFTPLAFGQFSKAQKMFQDYSSSFRKVPIYPVMKLKEKGLKGAKIVLVDVRSDNERKVSMIPGSLTAKDFEKNKKSFKEKEIIVYCTIGYRSGKYAERLINEGYNAHNLEAGIVGWTYVNGELVNGSKKTKKVHVYGEKWNIVNKGYDPVY